MAPRTPKDPEAKPSKPEKVAKAPKSAKASAAAKSPEKPALRVVEAEDVSAGVGQLKLKDLVDQVAEATGSKKADVKPVIEAMLAAMGAALGTGKALAVPPLGKLRVVKNKGPALTLKLRPGAANAAGLALADDAEDS